MNKKPADQTPHKLCQRISKLNKIDVCLHSSSHKQAVYEFSFFFFFLAENTSCELVFVVPVLALWNTCL